MDQFRPVLEACLYKSIMIGESCLATHIAQASFTGNGTQTLVHDSILITMLTHSYFT